MSHPSKPGADLNLPDGISQLYQRRYSDPGKSSEQTTNSRSRRRFSLSTFDDLKDISSGKIRSCVNKVLKTSGFTAIAKSKSDQMRRYSLYADEEVDNDLGSSNPGTSFLARSMSLSASRADGSNVNSVLRRRSLTSYLPKHDTPDSFRSWHNSVSETNSPTPELCFYDRRKSTHLDAYDCLPFPKCKYKLRENGVIASELASSFGVQIEDASTRSNPKSVHVQGVNGDDTRRPEAPLHETTRSTRTRKMSNLAAMTNVFKLKQRKLSTGSLPSPDGFSTPLEPRITTRGRPASHVASSRHGGMSSPPGSSGDAHHAPSLQAMRKTFARQNSKINFEMIGCETLHGSPNYAGRLKLCTFRSPTA